MSGEAAALTFLLRKVTEVLIDYKDVKTGAGYEFRQLSDELLLLKAFLRDSAKKSNKEELFREKERQIRELVYDVEDTIDTFLTRRAVAKNKNAFGRLLEKSRNDLAQKVKLLRQRKVRPVVDVIEREFGKIEDGNGSSTSLGKPRTDLKKGQSAAQPSIIFIHNEQQQCVSLHNEDEESIGEDRIVDFEEEEIIISYLKESKDELDVISISSMAGLGKTTLARKIFQNEEIRRKFPLRIWIHVSQKFKSRDVLLEILGKFIPGGTPSLRDEELIPTVRSCFANKEFLLVTDDVWTVADWDVIEKILPRRNGKGKVLVTSRQRDLAALTNVNRKPVDLSPLKSGKSLQLLKVTVFGSAKACPGELEHIGQAIANKCGGVPLIIVAIGEVLKLQFTDTRAISGLRQKWLDVLGNVNKILLEDKNKSISDVLELSYNRLPDDLRMCFLYTGLFPENHDIPASTLTQLWIAEGFIQRQDGQSFEENADKILDALINMNLLTVAKKNLDQVKTCGVHDMIREFCKAKATEQNLFRVMKSDGVIEPSVAELQHLRRLCLHSDPLRFLSEKPKGPRVRSFLCFNEPFDLDATHLSTIPDAFNLLRVLSCKSIKFRQFPEVTKLKLLKHITLFIDNLIVLPEQLSQIINLQTLIVETNSRSIKAKANIWKMIQLRRLKAKAAISLNGKKWEGKASENLQTISRLSPDSCVAALSKRAPNLKTLGIQGKVANLFNTFSLQEFHRLEKLKLVNDLDGASASENPLLALPQWSHFPPIIKRLTLSKTYLDWGRHMPILAQINTLKVLKLKDNAFAGAFWIADNAHNSFQELQFLLIENSGLVIWEDWNPSTTHFRSLTWLVLKNCKKLEKIPVSLADNLEKLDIDGVKKSAAESAREIESAANRRPEENHKWVVPFKLTVLNEDC